jgi:molybdopterin adenylyltransferase
MTTMICTITVSDSRTQVTDAGGQMLRKMLQESGFGLGLHQVVHDDVQDIRDAVRRVCGADAIVLTGGTGIGPRDVTIEAVEPLLTRKLDGFGEAFRRLSWEQVGARSVLSRALAGTLESKLVFVLPGSPKAVALGVKELIVPLLEHAMRMLAGGGHDEPGHHHHHGG